jgi:adenylate cyclase
LPIGTTFTLKDVAFRRIPPDPTITTLELEESKSELKRSYLLITLFAFIFLAAVTNFFISIDHISNFYGGTLTFITLALFLCVFLIYQLLVLIFLKRQSDNKCKTTLTFKIIHTMIEVSFPSAIIFYMLYNYNMLSFIDSPVSLIYFLFITLSVLHLDHRVSIFTGLYSALVYSVIIYYGFNYLEVSPDKMPSGFANAHYVRSLILIMCGGAAGYVAMDLKNRIKATYDSQQARNEMELLFGQQVSREVSRALIEEKGVTKKLEATVMFLDIRNFTAFADSHTPDEVIDYQNRFIGPVIDIINQHQGVVFQILGDGLMACFGSPVENVLHADMAFQASLEIVKRTKESADRGLIPPTMIGIGLHSGDMVTGNIGNENRKQFSISGSPVIVASRIEQLNKKYGTQFLISGEVFQRIAPGKKQICFLGEEPLRGIGKPVELYSVGVTD